VLWCGRSVTSPILEKIGENGGSLAISRKSRRLGNAMDSFDDLDVTPGVCGVS